MFNSQNWLLSAKGPLGAIWVAAYFHKKLKKAQVTQTHIPSSVDKILEDVLDVMTYRVMAYILLGVVRIHSRKVEYLFDDCHKVLTQINNFVVSKKGKLLLETQRAPFYSITRPARLELDAFDLEILEDVIEDNGESRQVMRLGGCAGSNNEVERVSRNHVSTDCTLVQKASTWLSQSNFEAYEENFEDIRFSQEECLYLEKFSGFYEESTEIGVHQVQEENCDLSNQEGRTENLHDDRCIVGHMVLGVETEPNESFRLPIEEQHRASEAELPQNRELQVQEENCELHNLEGRIHRGTQEKDIDDMVLVCGTELNESSRPIIEYDHRVSVAKQPEDGEHQVQEENCDLIILEGSIENLRENRCTLEQHVDIVSRCGIEPNESSREVVEEQARDSEQMKLLEAPSSDKQNLMASVEGHQESFDATPFESQCPTGEKFRQGTVSPKFMLIPTPNAKERARRTRKRKCLVDCPTVLPNEFLKQSIHDASDLVCKRRKVPRTALAAWTDHQISNLSRVFVEPLVPCISSELKSLFCEEISKKVHVSKTLTPSKSGKQSEAAPETQEKEAAVPSDVHRFQNASGFVKETENAQGAQNAETSGNMAAFVLDVAKSQNASGNVEQSENSKGAGNAETWGNMALSKSLSTSKSVEEEQLAPATPTARFSSSMSFYESPDSSNCLNVGRRTSSYESMDEEPTPIRDQELELTLMDEDPKSVKGSNHNLDGEFSGRTRTVAKCLHRNYSKQKKRGKDEIVNLLRLAEGKTKKENARLFHEILVLNSQGCVDVEQEIAYGDILVRKLPGLDQTFDQ